jgi:hypothetical protein
MPTVIRGSSGGNVITDSTYTPGMVIQYQSTQSNSFLSVGGTTPWDDTIPQSGEGTEVFAVSITPKFTNSKLFIESRVFFSPSAKNWCVLAFHQDSAANAIAATGLYSNEVNGAMPVSLGHTMTAATTSATTFKVRLGSATPVTLNVNGPSGARKLGGVMSSYVSVWEIAQ